MGRTNYKGFFILKTDGKWYTFYQNGEMVEYISPKSKLKEVKAEIDLKLRN